MIFRRNNINTKRDVEQGTLASLLRRYGSIGGANPRIEQESRAAAARANGNGVPAILARIYAPTTLDIAPLPYEASNVAESASMIERIYERAKPEAGK